MACAAVCDYVVRVVGISASSQRGFVVRFQFSGLAAAPAAIPVTLEYKAPCCRPAPGIQACVLLAHDANKSASFAAMNGSISPAIPEHYPGLVNTPILPHVNESSRELRSGQHLSNYTVHNQ